IEEPGEGQLREGLMRDEGKLGDAKSREIKTPLPVEVPLPKDWRKTLALAAGAKVAVVASSARLEMPDDRDLLKLGKMVSRLHEPVWSGVLRSTFIELPTK